MTRRVLDGIKDLPVVLGPGSGVPGSSFQPVLKVRDGIELLCGDLIKNDF